MVDPIRTGAIKANELKVGAVARTTGLTRAATAETATAPPRATTLARSLAASAPVDADRVARIRQAMADGTFPLSSSTIADRLIALRYEWMNDDKA